MAYYTRYAAKYAPKEVVLAAYLAHMPELIGRTAARAELERAYNSTEAALVSVIGRRRVGKTFLVRETYAERLAFTLTGIRDASKRTQLDNFSEQLRRSFVGDEPGAQYDTWLAALAALADRLEAVFAERPRQRVVFFDELPWLASPKSGFLQGFAWFWNSWAQAHNVVVVICGSAAAWMIRKVVRARGSLHNRITHRIALFPFSLRETELFLRSRGVALNRYQQLLVYLALGGVPFYLEQVRVGESAVQAIDRLLFGRQAPLAEEFRILYASLFDDSEDHVRIVRELARKRRGLTRSELVAGTGLLSGGTLSRRLEELELSGFLEITAPLGKRRKGSLYRLIDEYSLFYLRYLDGRTREPVGTFVRLAATPSFVSWAGFSFEGVCLRHTAQLQRALGISGMHVVSSSFTARATDEANGVQIDLLLDRADGAISLLEAKFAAEPFVITKKYAAALREKIARFRVHTHTRKQVFLVLVAPYGLRQNEHSLGLIQGAITADDLFA